MLAIEQKPTYRVSGRRSIGAHVHANHRWGQNVPTGPGSSTVNIDGSRSSLQGTTCRVRPQPISNNDHPCHGSDDRVRTRSSASFRSTQSVPSSVPPGRPGLCLAARRSPQHRQHGTSYTRRRPSGLPCGRPAHGGARSTYRTWRGDVLTDAAMQVVLNINVGPASPRAAFSLANRGLQTAALTPPSCPASS